jgi:hypothetical protein
VERSGPGILGTDDVAASARHEARATRHTTPIALMLEKSRRA